MGMRQTSLLKFDCVDSYNDMRNKLIHQRATAAISEDEVSDFREIVETVLMRVYDIKFGKVKV